jgi:hypothetical protein
MLEVLAPRTNDIAGVLIDSIDAAGEPVSATISDEGWSAMDAAAASLIAETDALRERPILVVAEPGRKIFGEETSGLTAADVHAMIEADRTTFDYYLDIMRADFVRMRDAIGTRDAATLWAVSWGVDAKCNACHEVFWYPDWEEEAQPPQ